MIFFLAVAFFLFPLASAEDQPILVGGVKFCPKGFAAPSGWVQVPSEAVAGFPLIVSMTMVGGSQTGHTEYVVDLAMDQREIVSRLFIGFDGESGDGYWIGEMGEWPDRTQSKGVEPRVRLREGEQLTQWFDVARLARTKTYGLRWGRRNFEECGSQNRCVVDEPLPVVGDWKVSAFRGQTYSIGENPIQVREPNQDENEALALLRAKGAGLSWFPDVVLEENEIPEELVRRLPETTRRTVRLIQILRASYLSFQKGLEQIYLYSDEEWGYLEPLIGLIEYECLRGEARNEGAATVRARWEYDVALQANFRLVDNGVGLIQRFRNAIPSRQD